MSGQTKKNIYTTIMTATIMLLMVFFKVYYSSMKEFHLGEDAFHKRDLNMAITHFERAIHWYTPFNQYVSGSAKGLWEIGEMAEKQNDSEVALLAYRTLRSGFYAVRSFYTPYKDWIDKCNEKISAILASQEVPSGSDTGKSFEERKREALKTLKTESAPHVGWSIFLEIGFVGWVACTILLIFHGIKRGFEGRKTWLLGILTIFFYMMWIAGLMRA